MAGKRDWLILSIKWSKTERHLCWYQTNESGYTDDLMRAGRYTEEEANAQPACEDIMGVPLEVALAASSRRVKVEMSSTVIKSFQLHNANRESEVTND
jgi:hypothetical protein